MRRSRLILLLLLGGCASAPVPESDAERKGYERGYGQAVKEQYWIIQNRQRATPPTESKPHQP
ncbi:MAG: hypothetical protein JWM32_1586 [Verrucomicrobia bacterium]|nr:hypothetical protein [Verrucomicrobiota bacterium]